MSELPRNPRRLDSEPTVDRPTPVPPPWAPWALAAITLVVYSPAVFNNFVDWDDVTFIAGNPRFNPPTLETLRFYWTHAGASLYMPVTYSLWAGLAWLGYGQTPDAMDTRLNPYLFHLTAVLLHAAAVLLVFYLLRRVVRQTGPAFAGALVFAVHPVQVESVAFIGTMNTGIAATLALGALLLFLKSGDTRPGTDVNSSVSRWRSTPFLLGTLLFILAMLAKPTAVMVPALAVLLERATRRCGWTAAVRLALPWLLVCVPCVIWTRHIQPAAEVAGTPLWFRPVIAADAAAFYLHTLLIPAPLGIDYGRTPQWLFAHPSHWFLALILVALLLAILLLRQRRLLLAFALAVVALLPNSGLVRFDYQLNSTVADRYLYLPMLGVSLAVAAAVAWFPRRLLIVPLLVLTCLWSGLTELQIRTWRDGESLFSHALAVQPRSWMSAANLAELIGDKEPARAIVLCHEALNLRPETAFAWNNLGSLLMDQHRTAEALAAFQRAHQLAPGNKLFALNFQRASAATRPATQ